MSHMPINQGHALLDEDGLQLVLKLEEHRCSLCQFHGPISHFAFWPDQQVAHTKKHWEGRRGGSVS